VVRSGVQSPGAASEQFGISGGEAIGQGAAFSCHGGQASLLGQASGQFADKIGQVASLVAVGRSVESVDRFS
jgi:hypothetical protein